MAVRVLTSKDPLPVEPPSEFRIFYRGVNHTTKGSYLFDDVAAADVMAAYTREGVDLMIDLEHESLNDKALRADSRDARGWFNIELRDGELWAVNVSWGPDGERRIRERTQRYTSPAFDVNKQTRRVMCIHNVALVGMPATLGATPLIAASKQLTAAERGSLYVFRRSLNGS